MSVQSILILANEFKRSTTLRIVTHCTQCLGYYDALLEM